MLYVKKLISSLIFNMFAVFTFVFFSPLEVYLGNPSDFHVYTDSAVLLLGLVALGGTLAFSFLCSVLPTKILKSLNMFLFAFGLCMYVQSLFLNGELIILDGEKLTIPQETVIVNTLIWLGILLSVFIVWYLMKKKHHEKMFVTATKYIAVAITVMQLTGFVSLYVNCDKAVNVSKSLYFSNQGELELSAENNVVYFVIDYCDGQVVTEALGQDPGLFDGFDGFTYYPNASYTHSRTYPALTYLLSGEKCFFDKPYTEYVDEAFEVNPYMSDIDRLGADVRVFTDTRYVGESATAYIDNYKITDSTSLSSVDIGGFYNKTLKISGFRSMPYVLKSVFAYTTEEVNEASIIRVDDYAKINDDLAFYQNLQESRISVNDQYSSAFRFYHFYGSHPGAVVNENAEYQEDVSLPQALRGNMKIIREYIDQLKEKGIYDNTTIIITADHGYVGFNFDRPQIGIMLVKMAGSDSSAEIQISNAPVCHDDLFPTVIKALGGDYRIYGISIDEILESGERERYHYNTVLDPNTGLEVFLDEYLITGDARDFNNYQFTGKRWEIDFTI